MNEWDDRAIDAALQEVHGSRPPDLSARVLLALREPASGALPVLRREDPASGPSAAWRWLLVAALMFVTIGVTWAVRSHEVAAPTDERLALVELIALDGDVECVEARPAGLFTTPIAQGQHGVFVARPGNRLRCRAAARCRVGAFGVLALQDKTELEVRSMEFTVKNGVAAASALTLSVVAGVVTWHSLSQGETASAGEKLRIEARSDASAELRAENERLQKRVQQLEQQNEALLASRTPVPAAPKAKPPEEAPTDAPAPSAVAVTFDDPKFADALAKVDWKLVGTVSKEMQPLLAELVAAMAKDGDVPPELAIKIQQLNTQLVAQLPGILKAGLPGFGPNGAYTHPLFVANSVASTLDAAGHPLDATQREAIAGLVRAFSAENQSIADQPRDSDLERLLAETEMKERFYSEVASRLTPEQFASLYPEGSAEYDGANLFRPGLMMRVYSEPVPAHNAAEFARVAGNRFGEELGLDEATSQKVRGIIESMAGASPELWQTPGDVAENKLRMLRSGRSTSALKRQIAFLREVQRQIPLTPAQQKKLAKMQHVLVPLPQ